MKFIYYFILINSITLTLMFLDKQMAIRRKQRISEFSFLLLSMIGGFFGIWTGILLFKHKSRKVSFQMKILLGTLLFTILKISTQTLQ